MEFSLREEIANAVTHGIGALLCIPALVLLIVFAVDQGTTLHVVSFTIFGVSMLLLYTFSTLTHSLRGTAKKVFEILDHSAIYLLIAGTYTPIALITIGGTSGWTLFGIVWGIALVGITYKAFFVDRFIFVSTICYVAMGWMVMFFLQPVYNGLTTGGFLLLLLGGLFYTIGTVFFLWKRIPYHHAIWHVFVLAGSASIYFAILFYV
ncbi:PAQR family membrane homeostasis protein TrhA [Aureibacillus halotolerans]|uniref:Hemolysin III n=1 Tax=Aureibacillus halotolerans TaxID=1508390 RepID=A0A4R6TVZ9_9BACI|nr:hemolysin III family protein [Aureibacillus halotolerans]TDQ36413.1 hemolysin III [Aureibacillus halotolerans]